MAGQDLLYQRRSRARHADDEHRCRRRIARATPVAHQFRGEHRADPLDQAQRHRFVISDAPALQRIACKEVMKRPFVLADILQRLAQREVQMYPVIQRQRHRRLHKLLHRQKQRIVDRQVFALDQVAVVRAFFRCEQDRGPVGVVRLFEPPQAA